MRGRLGWEKGALVLLGEASMEDGGFRTGGPGRCWNGPEARDLPSMCSQGFKERPHRGQGPRGWTTWALGKWKDSG